MQTVVMKSTNEIETNSDIEQWKWDWSCDVQNFYKLCFFFFFFEKPSLDTFKK